MNNLKTRLFSFFKIVWPFVLILVIISIFFWKVFLKGFVPIPADFVVGVYFPWLDYIWAGYGAGVPVKNPITTDVVSFMYPMQIFAIDLIKNYTLPLWNNYILGGLPLLANFQSAPFSPTNIFYFFFNNSTAWTIQIILQHIFAVIFTYILLRYWKVSKLGSVLGGIIYAFSGYNLIWSQWNGHTLTASYIPILVYLTQRFLDKQSWFIGFLVSLVVFLMFVSGYPQTFIYLFFAISILRVINFVKEKSYLIKTFLIIIFYALGVGLSAIQIIPGYELLKESQRVVEPHPYEWAFLPYKKVITFVAPDFYGNHATKNYWGPQDYTSNTGFVGVVALILALISLSDIKKNKNILFGFVLIVISLALAFPTPVSIFLWKSGLFGLNAASAHRSLVLFNLGIAILTAIGFDQSKYNKRILIIPAILIIGFGLYAFNINQFVGLRNLVLPLLVWFGVCFVFILPKFKYALIFLSVVELFYFGWKFTPFSPKEFIFPSTPVIEFLQSINKPNRVVANKVIPINFLMNYKIETVEGYDAVYPLRVSKLLAAINGRRSGTDPLGRYGTVDDDASVVLDLFNAKYNVVKRQNLKNYNEYYKFKKVFEDKSVVILENTTVLPRAFFVCDWEVENTETKIIDKLLSNDFDYSKKIIIEKEINAEKCYKNKFNLEYLEYKTNSSKIKISNDNEGLLFVSDTYYPGWNAYVDGQKIEILRANFAFRAVVLNKGEHVVEFIYEPESFNLGLKISLTSLFFLILFSLGLRRYTNGNNEK